MAKIEMTSGQASILSAHVHYEFHWMGDHWKQEITSLEECQSIPKIWSVEGLVADPAHSRFASPTFQQLRIEQETTGLIVARLEGESDSHQFSGKFSLVERPDEVVVDVELTDRHAAEDSPLAATYLIESSGGHLVRSEAATITWLIPETRLAFEADPPGRIEAHETGMGTIRLIALADPDPAATVRTLRYRWKWIINPVHQIWDREV